MIGETGGRQGMPLFLSYAAKSPEVPLLQPYGNSLLARISAATSRRSARMRSSSAAGDGNGLSAQAASIDSMTSRSSSSWKDLSTALASGQLQATPRRFPTRGSIRAKYSPV